MTPAAVAEEVEIANEQRRWADEMLAAGIARERLFEKHPDWKQLEVQKKSLLLSFAYSLRLN